MTKRALIVIDIQNDYFPSGRWPLSGVELAADNAARLIVSARNSGGLVVYIRHEFLTENAPFFAAGSNGAELHPKILNRKDELVVVKHFPNAFRETDLKTALDQNAIQEVVICGSMSHMCVDSTARAANDLGYKVTVIHDACATRDLEFCGMYVPAAYVHTAFMAALDFGYATLCSTEEHLLAAEVGAASR